jgi:hypothetical protein
VSQQVDARRKEKNSYTEGEQVRLILRLYSVLVNCAIVRDGCAGET